MINVVIFKLLRFNFISKNISIDDSFSSSFTNIKKYVLDNYTEIVSNNDIVLWIYGGKIINESTDLTSITHPICCYILTYMGGNDSYNRLFSNIFNTGLDTLLDVSEFIYRDQMNQMLDMGFTNEGYIRDALILTEGRLVDAITMYMSF